MRKAAVKADKVLSELANSAFSDIGAIIDFTGTEPKMLPANQISEQVRRTISSIKIKRHVVKVGEEEKPVEVIEFGYNLLKALLETLAKHLAYSQNWMTTG